MVASCRKRATYFSGRISAVALFSDLACNACTKREKIDEVCDACTDWLIFSLGEYAINWGNRCFVVKGISRSIGPIHNFSFGFNSFVRPEMALQINAGKSVDW